MKKLLLLAVMFIFGITIAPKSYAAIGDFPWNYNGSNIYFNSGNVGIGTTNPVDNLTINYSTPSDSFSSSQGKAYIGDGAGSWWIAGTKGKDGRGYNNIATNGYVSDRWYRREIGKETWVLSSFVTENNAGYFKIFHADPQSTSAITNLKALFYIDPLGNTEINGKLKTKQVTVTASGWADYVFSKDYKLKSLPEVETYINQNRHLPNIPSSENLQKSGVDLGELTKLQMEKIEELTLHLIQKDKEVKSLQSEIAQIKAKIGL